MRTFAGGLALALLMPGALATLHLPWRHSSGRERHESQVSRLVLLALVGAASLPLASWSETPATVRRRDRAAAAVEERVGDSYSRLALAFLQNRGQVEKRVVYHAQAAGVAIFLPRDEAVIDLAPRRCQDSPA